MKARFLAPGLALAAGLVAIPSCSDPTRETERESVGHAQSSLVSPVFELAEHALAPSRRKPRAYASARGGGIALFTVVDDDRTVRFFRVDEATGESLDPLGVDLGFGYEADVAFDGTNFRVFWIANDAVNPVPKTARVAPNGTLVGAPALFATGISTPMQVHAACDAIGNCLAFVSSVASRALVRLDGQGNELDPQPMIVGAGENSLKTPNNRVVAVRDGFAIFWWEALPQSTTASYGIRARHIDAAGTLGPTVTLFEATPGSPYAKYVRGFDAAYNGSVGLVTWTTDTGASPWGAGLRIDPGFGLLDSAPFALSTASGPLDIVPRGNGFDVFSGSQASLSESQRTRVGVDGIVAASVPLSWPSGRAEGGTIAAGDDAHVIVATSGGPDSPNAWGVYAQTLDGAGNVVRATEEITSDLAQHGEPAVAWDGSSYLAIWPDGRRKIGIYASRVSASGTNVSTPSFLIKEGDEESLTLAANAGGALAMWKDRTGTQGQGYALETAFIAPDDTVSAPTLFGYVGYLPALATDGTGYLAVWMDARSFVSDISFARFNSSGVRLDVSGVKLTTANAAVDGSIAPKVAWTGSSYFVVWQQAVTSNSYDLFGARISPAGAVLSAPASLTNGLPILYAVDVDLACSPAECLVAWTNGGLMVRRFDSNGNALDAPTLVPQGNAFHPALAWDGQAFALAAAFPVSGPDPVKVRWMAPYGTWLGVDWTDLAGPTLDYEDNPSLASGGSGSALIGYRRYADYRAVGQILTNDGVPDAGPPAVPDGGSDASADASTSHDAGVIGEAGADASDDDADVPTDASLSDASQVADASHAADAGHAADTGADTGNVDAAPQGGDSASNEQAGCGCTTAGRDADRPGALLLLLAGGLVLRLRRARGWRSSRP